MFEINDDEIIVNLELELYAYGSGYMYEWDYNDYLNSKYRITISKSDWGNEYKEAYADFSITVDLGVVFNKKEKEFNFNTLDIISMERNRH